MGEPAAQFADQAAGKVDDLIRQIGPVHNLAGHDEERNGEQHIVFGGRHHSLRDQRKECDVIYFDKGEYGYGSKGDRNRNSKQQHGRKAEAEEGKHECISVSTTGSPRSFPSLRLPASAVPSTWPRAFRNEHPSHGNRNIEVKQGDLQVDRLLVLPHEHGVLAAKIYHHKGHDQHQEHEIKASAGLLDGSLSMRTSREM